MLCEEILKKLEDVKKMGDSLGGVVECKVTGLPIGIGDYLFEGLEGKIAANVFAIPAVKGVEFGLGFDFVNYKGSECNDAYIIKNNKIKTKTNNNGGILGGISNGMPIIVNVAIKPTPSIAKEQLTLNLKTKKEDKLIIKGRHDPCIAVRAVPVLEAALSIALLDLCIDMKGRFLK